MNIPLPDFSTDYSAVLERIDKVDVTAYNATRNHLHGAVSYLSPYISRGVVTLPQVARRILMKSSPAKAEKFIFELAWREYFQEIWWRESENIFSDLLRPQEMVEYNGVPSAIIHANTGIDAVDAGINGLYQTGYMHNHLRMYIASLCCNIGRYHWLKPATWMHYHLLDGDLASNMLSWQWVAGTFSSKKYYCNQENINRYTGSAQRGTFLDADYEALSMMDIPGILRKSEIPHYELPAAGAPTELFASEKILLYTPYHLDPEWRKEEKGLRILWFNTEHLHTFPISPRVYTFILDLASQIEGINIMHCSPETVQSLIKSATVLSRRHAYIKDLNGITLDCDDRLFPGIEVKGNSFMGFWKKCEKNLTALSK